MTAKSGGWRSYGLFSSRGWSSANDAGSRDAGTNLWRQSHSALCSVGYFTMTRMTAGRLDMGIAAADGGSRLLAAMTAFLRTWRPTDPASPGEAEVANGMTRGPGADPGPSRERLALIEASAQRAKAGAWLRRPAGSASLGTEPFHQPLGSPTRATSIVGGQAQERMFGCAADGRPPVLLVDDDPAVLALITMFTERAGYLTLTAPDGVTALRLIACGHPLAAIVSDYAMPDMTGAALLREVARTRPGLPAVIVTAHSDTASLGELPQGVEFLCKPFGRLEFVARLNRLTATGACIDPQAGRCGAVTLMS